MHNLIYKARKRKKRGQMGLNGAAVAVFSAVVILTLIIVVGNSFLQSIDQDNLSVSAKASFTKVESYMWVGVTLLAVGLLILVAAAIFVYIRMLG